MGLLASGGGVMPAGGNDAGGFLRVTGGAGTGGRGGDELSCRSGGTPGLAGADPPRMSSLSSLKGLPSVATRIHCDSTRSWNFETDVEISNYASSIQVYTIQPLASDPGRVVSRRVSEMHTASRFASGFQHPTIHDLTRIAPLQPYILPAAAL